MVLPNVCYDNRGEVVQVCRRGCSSATKGEGAIILCHPPIVIWVKGRRVGVTKSRLCRYIEKGIIYDGEKRHGRI